jgi:hypothetical protein
MEDDPMCPNGCGGSARLLPKVGDREDYDCPRCLAFSVAGSQKKALDACRRAALTVF